MDFVNFPPLSLPAADVSSNAIIYKNTADSFNILTGIRQDDPWKDTTAAIFGGYVDPSDTNTLATAIRECAEETGLIVELTGFVGIYGPERYHHVLKKTNRVFWAEKTNTPAHIRPVVDIVFAGKVVGGILCDSVEQKRFRWVKPDELVGKTLNFDHAQALSHFLDHKRRLAGTQILEFFN